MKTKAKSAITLIMLVITAIVLSILTTTVILRVTNTSVLDEAEIAAFKSDMVAYNEIYDSYVVSKTIKDITFDQTNLNLTQEDAEYTNIFGKVPDKYKEGLKVIKGKLVYITKDKKQNEVIEDMNMVPNKMKITNRLVHCTTSNTSTSVAYEKSYTSTLTADSGYTLQEVTVVMGGTDITSTAYNSSSKTITIDKVTDYVVITATTDANTYTVTHSLTQVTNSNSASTARTGTRYTGTLTANTGYTLKTVKVTMAGQDITSTAYNSSTRTVTIASVTGNIIITASATANIYSVTNNLTNVTTNNNNTDVTYGSRYIAELTPSSGYNIKTVTVTVNGVDVTNSAYNSSTNTITINSVVGNIVITASAEVANTYTVTYDLDNRITSSNTATSITEGSTYTTTITGMDKTTRGDFVWVSVGGVDVTDDVCSVVDDTTCTITITSVAGNINIYVGNGDIPVDPPGELYTIIYDLNGVTSSNTATSITEGSSYTTTLDPGWYDMVVEVSMGGQYITSTAYNSSTKTITIGEVTGNIVINAYTDGK